jgi:hypothetical protein
MGHGGRNVGNSAEGPAVQHKIELPGCYSASIAPTTVIASSGVSPP